MIDLSSINNTIGQLDRLIGSVKDKLLNNPDTASIKLAEVLAELAKILDFMENEIVEFLGINFSDDRSNLAENRIKLLSLESGYVMIKANEARGHCHKITNIYEKYLDKWFSKWLDKQDADNIGYVFKSMNTADGDMIRAIESLSAYLMKESEDILTMIDNMDLIGANIRIRQARLDLQTDRRDFVKSLSRLRLLQASFISSSEVV